jgi:predicted naringenin-chalcone synthase
MTTSRHRAPVEIASLRRRKPQRTAGPAAILLGLGTAIPAIRRSQQETAAELAERWRLRGAALKRWQRIIAGSGIEFRHGVLRADEIIGATTAQRMAMYERHAPPLAAEAANQALRAGGVPPNRITDLIVVSCTGFAAPGLDVALVERLGLSAAVRRSVIGFMGCFGAITGMRAAIGACAADPGACALVVCCELCSLHLRDDPSVENQVASALFADGAAAAVVSPRHRAHGAGDRPGGLGRLERGASLLLPEGRDWMSWRITDAGFAMGLSKEVPRAIRQAIGPLVADAGPAPPATFIVHPGGPDILDAVDEGLALGGGRGLAAARHVLGQFGNMSSGTVLFVLANALARGEDLPAMMLAFGPGLTIESILVNPVHPRPL